MQETIKNILGISELLLLPWVLCLVLPVGFVLFGIKPSRRMGMICLWISLVVLVLFAIRLYAFNGASLLFPSSDTKCTRGGFYSICNINESLLAFQFSLLVFALSICAFIIYPLGVVLCWFKKLRKFGLLCLCLTMPLILLFRLFCKL